MSFVVQNLDIYLLVSFDCTKSTVMSFDCGNWKIQLLLSFDCAKSNYTAQLKFSTDFNMMPHFE